MQPSNPTRYRSILSPLVAVSFVGLACSGILMLAHIRAFGVTPFHEAMGIVFAAAGLLHLLVNWRMFTALFRHRLAVVATIAATVLLGGILLAGNLGGDKGRRPRGGPPCVEVAPRAPQR